MKRSLCLFSALLLVAFWFTPTRALADEESVLLQVATVSGELGATVDIVVSMSNCVGVDSTEFDINYDPAALSVVSVTPGSVFPAEHCCTYTGNPGRIGVACARRLGFTGDGTLLTIRFEILSETGSAITITTHLPTSGEGAGTEVTKIDADYIQTAALLTIENGGVTVGDSSLPASQVTPWAPATPVPTPSPTPSATPEATPAPLQTEALPDATAATTATALSNLNPVVYYVGGGLLVAIVVLVVILLPRRKKNG